MQCDCLQKQEGKSADLSQRTSQQEVLPMLRKPRQSSLKPCKCWELRMLRQEVQRIPMPCNSTVGSHDCLVALTARQDTKKTA